LPKTKQEIIDGEFLEQRFTSSGQMFTYITDAFGRSPGSPVHLFVILPAKGVTVSKIVKAATKRRVTFSADRISDSLYRVRLGVRTRQIKGHLLTHKDWWLLITRGKGSTSYEVFIRSFVKNHFFPLLHPAYVDSHGLVKLAASLSSVFGTITLEEFSMASERGTLREWLQSGAVFSMETARSLQRKYDSSFTGLRLSGHSESVSTIRLRLYTESRLCFLSGSFGDFYEFVVIPFVHAALHTNKEYQGLERETIGGAVKISGIRIEAEDVTDADLLSIKQFILRNYASEISYENPVVVLQATDLRDGSSFDIYITKQGIEIVPLAKASSASLLELCMSIVRRLPPFAQFKRIPPIKVPFVE